MNTGQTMLTIVALLLLGTTALTVNSNNLNQGTILRQTEIGMYAIGLATSYFEKASNLDFDENSTLDSIVINRNQLSITLGTDGGTEQANVDSTFNDFDDYNNYDFSNPITNIDVFRVKIQVYYIAETPPYAKVNAPYTTATTTWYKQMDLQVIPTASRQAIEGGGATAGVDTIKMSYIYSYYQ
ncbi:MAG: hypothetical protein ABR936_05375 [Bacteroidota bacterium]|jgi:hypothetical protein